jgi:hypothetical protein
VTRLLELVGQSGIPFIIRSLDVSLIAVKARAVTEIPGLNMAGVKISNISERGLQHLTQNSGGSFQIEFILRSEKVQFYSKILKINRQGCVFAFPDYLESVERRKNARFGVSENLLAFMSFKNLPTDHLDFAGPPIFESARDLASLIPISDIGLGGAGLHFRFPSVSRVVESARPVEPATLCLPMTAPTAIDVSLRWSRGLNDQVGAVDGSIRNIRSFKLGIQFLSLSESQLQNIQVFIQRLSQADAI